MNKVYREDSIIVRITCAVIFLLFSFLYLYHYQADVMAMAQHVLSEGKTTYDSFLGALLTTITLYLLQIGVMKLLPLNSMFHAMTYFPSLLILAVITDVSPDIDRGFTFGAWLWAFPLLLILWFALSCVAKAFEVYEAMKMSHGMFSRTVWINLLVMSVMLMFVGLTCNSDEVFHYRMSVERQLVNRNYDAALKVGYKSLDTDSSLTMLRIYALAASGMLPERLFEYPLVGGSAAMKPNGKSVKMMLYTDTRLRGVRKSKTDYMLCSYLLDRNIDAFAKEIVKRYDLSLPLPKHYREALTLYSHIRSNPVVVYRDNVSDADYRDYQDMERKYANPKERQNMLRDTFGKTYWYYYDRK